MLAPYDYTMTDASATFLAPCKEHIFGTDNLGRDIFSRILVGTRYSLAIGVGSTLFCTFFGIIIGSISGYYGGRVDQVIMRLCDVVQSVPGMILNFALSCVLGNGVFNTILALGISGIAGTARLMRASILKVRKMEYVDAAVALNGRSGQIIAKHIIPNSLSPIIVQATMGVGMRIISASGLSYLGLGVQPPTPEWGAMLSAGRNYIKRYPYMTVIPGICIIITVLALNLFGDGLRDALDPKLKK
ncbi:MAG: ABC transporter permease [Lachnospiraceae bacterium]|nr:ABC transporter permease [Lachnospiraceae bacterium]